MSNYVVISSPAGRGGEVLTSIVATKRIDTKLGISTTGL
jgi:hypothetical protein